MFVSYFAHFISILMYSLVFVYFTIGCQKSSLARNFLKKSKDGNKEGLFQGSSSSSLRREALIRAVHADFP
jgi:hypothetical protein